MEAKVCNVCKKGKELVEFHRNPTKLDGVQSMCKSCRKIYHREHYLANKEKYITKAKIASKKRIFKWQEFKSTLKCTNCQEDRWWLLDFHHLNPKEKDKSLSNLLYHSKERIKKELDKCIVLCANCHRDLHHQQKLKALVA